MMNSPFVRTQATRLAERLLAADTSSAADRLNGIYLAAYGRPGSPEEIQQGLEFVEAFAREPGENALNERRSAVAQLCHAILISSEFLTHD